VANKLPSRVLPHCFADTALEKQAFTHISVGGAHNERLEWLGDALLDLLVGRLLFERYPDWSEGVLSQARSQLVNGDALAVLAQQIGLPARLILGAPAKVDGRRQYSILAGVLEAYMAAVYLDGGYETAMAVTAELFAEPLARVGDMRAKNANLLKDAKTRLQEYLQNRKQAVPKYETVARGGKAHNPFFVVKCRLPNGKTVTTVASNRREAEKTAAGCLLAALTV
jgi:ribonuclease-3